MMTNKSVDPAHVCRNTSFSLSLFSHLLCFIFFIKFFGHHHFFDLFLSSLAPINSRYPAACFSFWIFHLIWFIYLSISLTAMSQLKIERRGWLLFGPMNAFLLSLTMIGLASCLLVLMNFWFLFSPHIDDRLGRSWEEVLTDLHKTYSLTISSQLAFFSLFIFSSLLWQNSVNVKDYELALSTSSSSGLLPFSHWYFSPLTKKIETANTNH